MGSQSWTWLSSFHFTFYVSQLWHQDMFQEWSWRGTNEAVYVTGVMHSPGRTHIAFTSPVQNTWSFISCSTYAKELRNPGQQDSQVVEILNHRHSWLQVSCVLNTHLHSVPYWKFYEIAVYKFELLSLLCYILLLFSVPLGRLCNLCSFLALRDTCFVFSSISVKQAETQSPTLSSGIFPGVCTGEIHIMSLY